MTIQRLAEGRDNNFNLVRFIAAAAVLVSHAWPLALGTEDGEPLKRLLGLTIGTASVMVFFSISGFLVAKSWDQHPNLGRFAGARFRRIYPGLLLALLLTALVHGAAFSEYGALSHLEHASPWKYILHNLSLFRMQWGIDGVFGGGALNGSLWTLPYEVTCYIALGLLGSTALLRQRSAVALLVMICVAAVLRDALTGGLFSCFVTGCLAWRWRSNVSLNGASVATLLLASAAATYLDAPLSRCLLSIAIAAGSLYLALVPRGAIRAFNRVGDYSYGIYIYAFVVEVTIHRLWPSAGVATMIGTAFGITMPLAMISWHLVERPALHWRFNRGLVVRKSPEAAPM